MDCEVETPMALEYVEDINDNYKSLTPLDYWEKEIEFLEKHCGDGWHDACCNTACGQESRKKRKKKIIFM